MHGELETLADELSLRALAQQETRLDELRSRTGTLLAASSLVTSFLGTHAIDSDGVTTLAGLALGAFAFSVVGCVSILILNPRLVFRVRGTRVFEEEFAPGEPIDEAHRRLAYWLDFFVDRNQPTLNRLFIIYQLAAIAVLAEAILWTIGLAA